MKVEVVVEVEPPVTYSAPRGCGAADCWLTMVGGGVWKTGQDWMSTSVCTEERTSENNTNQFHLFVLFHLKYVSSCCSSKLKKSLDAKLGILENSSADAK